MMTPQTVLGYVKAEPFRPFRLHLESGRTFEIRHPEMVKVLKSHIIVFESTGDHPEIFDGWESASLMLAESITPIDASFP